MFWFVKQHIWRVNAASSTPLTSPLGGHQMVNTAGSWKRVGTMWNARAPTCPSMRPTPSLSCLHPTTRPSMPQDLSASQVQTQTPYFIISPSVLYLPFFVSLSFVTDVVFHFSLLRLCTGHYIPHAVLPFPHVCCQTAHSHVGELPWNSGKTLTQWYVKSQVLH